MIKIIDTKEGVILRDMIEQDVEDYVRWCTVETLWQNTDTPWDIPEETNADKEREGWQSYYNVVSLLSDDIRRWKFEIEHNGRHVGYLSSYHINENYQSLTVDDILQTKPSHVAIGIVIAEPQAQSKGVGTSALRIFINYLFEHGFDTIHIQTWSGHKVMMHIAQKLGFVECDRKIGVRLVDGQKFDALTYRLNKHD